MIFVLTGGRCHVEVIEIENPFVAKQHTSITEEILLAVNNATN